MFEISIHETTDEFKDRIRTEFNNNKKQLEVVFSKNKRMLLEAPAGCGKTKTIVGRISYLLYSRQATFPKKILVLTFSVNAAYKLKNDVAKGLEGSKVVDGVVQVHNYHSFARSVLRIYGHTVDSSLSDIDEFDCFSGDDIKEFTTLRIKGSTDDFQRVIDFNIAVKNANEKIINEKLDSYLHDIKKYCLPKKLITYNAILCFAIKILQSNASLIEYYHAVFSHIIFDEFQDTNFLMYMLLQSIYGEKTSLLFVGDPLQQIYGFIGSISDIFDRVERKYKLKKYELTENFRFKDIPDMLLLDRNIRAIAKNPIKPSIVENAKIKHYHCDSQNMEAIAISKKVKKLLAKTNECKIAILANTRTQTDAIVDCLRDNNIDYFWALFADGDKEYIKFHNFLHSITKIYFENKKFIVGDLKDYLKNKIDKRYLQKDDMVSSLVVLMDKFFYFLENECQYMSQDDKKEFVLDIFENHALKQYIEYVDAKVIISTIHAAKGLEWDYVLLPDMEKDSFPFYSELCNICSNKYTTNSLCKFDIKQLSQQNNKNKFLQVLSVFYVAVTRAKKEVLFFSSQCNYQNKKKAISCLLSLDGINVR